MTMKKLEFLCAKPVWEKSMQTEMNHSLVFSAEFDGTEEAVLCIAAQARYQIFLNGNFFAAGPARAGHGFFRIDRYELKNPSEKNIVEIIVAGYNSNSFWLTDQPSFLCAEIIRSGTVIAATGKNFTAKRFSERLKKVQRYSFQRPFVEVYDYSKRNNKTVELEECEAKAFIDRNAPYCEYGKIFAKTVLSQGTVSKELMPKTFNDRSLMKTGEKLKGFDFKELECCSVNEAYKFRSKLKSRNIPFEEISVPDKGTVVFDMGIITTGYAEILFESENAGTLYAVINEMLPENNIPDPGRDGCSNVIKWTFDKGGNHHFITFEPYDYKYIQLIFIGTGAKITGVSQIREVYPESKLVKSKKMPDEALQKIYDAAKESFVQNATDIFTDCPGRERAGWLCDSFFTARVENSLTGKSLVEKDFLENFIMPESFKVIPEGMIPCCYPADHYDGLFIHNWAMWYVLQLREYLARTGDREVIDNAKERMLSLLRFTEKYENENGLLQDLDSWIFVEWSEANDYVLDINYPTNMLYSMMLDALAELYGMPELSAKADKLRKTIIEIAFDGKFFRDNSVLDKNGKAILTENCSETCQYYAFFSGTATKETFPELYETMMAEFGPNRDTKKTYPKIPKSNAFIGNYLRLELMFRDGMYDKMLSEIKAFFLPMAETTGTLWENMYPNCSCNHGFASHVIYWLNSIFK